MERQNHPCQNHTRAEPTNDAWKFARAKEEKGNEQEAPQLLMPLGRWSSTASCCYQKGRKRKGVFGLAVYHSGSYWW